MSEFINHASTSQHNFNISLLNIPEAVSFFDEFDQQIQDMTSHLNSLPKLTAQDSFYFVTTFLLIAQRQMRNAFSLILRRMSYDGLLLFRVGLESAVFAYRIFSEPHLLEVWAQKDDNWKEFSQRFRFDEFPKDMPFRAELRQQLDLLNNYWAHPNINYFSTAVVFEKKEIKVHFFDHDDQAFHLVLLSFLDYCIKILLVFRKMLEQRFRVFITSTESDYGKIVREFELLKRKYRARATGKKKP